MEKYLLEPWVEKFDLDMDPYQVLRCFDDSKHPVLLDSGVEIEGLGRFSIVSADPECVFKYKTNTFSIEKKTGLEHDDGDGLQALKSLLSKQKSDYRGPLPFYGGAIGFFSYDLKDSIETLPATARKDADVPDIWFGFYNWALIHDRVDSVWWIVVSEWIHEPEKLKDKLVEKIGDGTERVLSLQLPERKKAPEFTPNISYEDYLKSVARVREYIRSGDIYQVNFTQRFHCTFEGAAVDLYGKIRKINPAPFAAYLDTGEHQVVCASPERFISLKNGLLETRPIKGTRPRGKTEEEDELNRSELINSEKDQSELLMIVDLERNDLGRVARTGTVKVTELFKLETYATVFHLVASVQAELKDGLDITDVIRATFPGGSITGAPKIRAMEIIDELEPTQRNLYTGSIGYIGFNGDSDLNIVIRTIMCKEDQAWFNVGGGVVWDSDPQMEYEESLHKASAQMRGLSQ